MYRLWEEGAWQHPGGTNDVGIFRKGENDRAELLSKVHVERMFFERLTKDVDESHHQESGYGGVRTRVIETIGTKLMWRQRSTESH